jgi:hypothetical protein
MTAKRKKGRPIGDTLGGIIVGFDQQIFRTTPPVQELIAKGQPVRGVSGEDGSEFEVVFPDDVGAPGPPERPDAADEAQQSEPPATKPDAAP